MHSFENPSQSLSTALGLEKSGLSSLIHMEHVVVCERKCDSEERESKLQHYLAFIVSHVSKCPRVSHHG